MLHLSHHTCQITPVNLDLFAHTMALGFPPVGFLLSSATLPDCLLHSGSGSAQMWPRNFWFSQARTPQFSRWIPLQSPVHALKCNVLSYVFGGGGVEKISTHLEISLECNFSFHTGPGLFWALHEKCLMA